MIEYIFRPIDKWPREFTKVRRRNSPFDTTFEKTIRQLTAEAERMGARNVIIQLALEFGQIRRDGLPYADALPTHPGVIVAFEGKHGPVKMPCDAFAHWNDNLRAIVLTLEHLRGIDRYGVSTMGEQYRGWTALPPGPDAAKGLTVDEAALVLNEFAPFVTPDWIRGDREAFKTAQRAARIKAHPDNGGSNEAFKRVEQAAEVLARLHGEG
jgi:hypothetical protein